MKRQNDKRWRKKEKRIITASIMNLSHKTGKFEGTGRRFEKNGRKTDMKLQH